MKTNHIVIVLDNSSSIMDYRLTEPMRLAVNGMLKTIRERSQAEGQQTFLSMVTFDDHVKVKFYPTDIRGVKDLEKDDYRPYGNTALFEGVGEGVALIDRKVAKGDDVSFLVLVFTDGENNRIYEHTPQKVKKLIADKQDTDRWTFAFQMPPGRGAAFARTYGVPAENICEWEQTIQGVREVETSVTRGITNYYSHRSKGAMSTKSFYVTTDMSKVDLKQVQKQLEDVTSRFKSIAVDKECTIQSIVEYKTGKYLIGSGFYELTKAEKVQKDKAVVLMERGKKTIWGGAAARRMIGLPDNQDAKVEPGDHSKWLIFIQSRSPNRKLVRGTRVLVDTGLVKGLPPTWDYLAAAAATQAKGN